MTRAYSPSDTRPKANRSNRRSPPARLASPSPSPVQRSPKRQKITKSVSPIRHQISELNSQSRAIKRLALICIIVSLSLATIVGLIQLQALSADFDSLSGVSVYRLSVTLTMLSLIYFLVFIIITWVVWRRWAYLVQSPGREL